MQAAPAGGARPRRLVIWAVVLGAVLLAGIGAQQLFFSGRTAPSNLPDFDRSGMEPQVAEKIGSLRTAVMANPESAGAWGQLGMNFDVHGLKQEAVPCYERAANLQPDEFRWPYYCAIALREIGSRDALEWFQRSLKLKPDYGPLLLRYGQALFDAGSLEESERALRQATEADEKLSQAYIGLARIALSQDDAESARAHLERASQVNPNHGAVHGLLAQVYRRLGERGKADEEMRRARQLPNQPSLDDPVYAALLNEGVSSRSYLVRGQVYMEQGRPAQAARQFELALESRPDADTHNNLGMALQFLGKFDEAAEHHRAALALRPDFREAMANLGTALYEMGSVEEGLAHVERAKELDPEFAQPYLSLGIFYTRLGRTAEAIEVLREGLARAPFDLRIANRLAWLLATSPRPELREGEEAVRWAEMVCQITGYRVPEPMDVLAAAYAEAGRFAKAAETARRARELAVAAGRTELADRIQSRLALYEANRPYREKPR